METDQDTVEGLRRRVAELEAANAAAAEDLRFLDAMERIGRRMQGASALEELLEQTLDDLLEQFGCDRAWLLYPADPSAPSWSVPMERTVPEWPGAFALGVTVPMDEGVAGAFSTVLAADGPVAFDPTTDHDVPPDVRAAFGVRSQLVAVIRPHSNKPWMLGLHHCADEHVFSAEEIRIFDGLGQRIVEALDAMILLRDLRASETQVAALQRMQAIGSLAGGVAHDFNNQLLVVLCYADMLRDELAREPGLPEVAYVDRILDACDKAARLTRQLLAISRRSVLDPRPVDLRALVGDSLELLRRAVGAGVTIVLDGDPDAGAAVAYVDEHSCEQVLLNLVTNARDALPRGGTIGIGIGTETVAAGTPHPVELEPGDYVVLEVADDGVGMDAETVASVFEPFFTTKERGRGTGLGLSTAYGVARQSGGVLTAASAPGEGSTFRLWLPASAEPAAARSSSNPALGKPGGDERVLFVDDLPEAADIAQRVLGGAGYRVTTAAGSAEALALLDGGPFDLLLTDVEMAGADGVELATRAMAAHPQLRITFATGYSVHAMERLRAAGAGRRVLQKPYSPSALLAHVRAVLDA